MKQFWAANLGISILVLLGTIAPVRAGGSSWEVAIERLEIESPTEATVTFQVVNPRESWYPHCPRMSVAIAYLPERWGEKTWSESIVTRSTHLKAMTFLDRANHRRETLRFGTFASGLGKQKARSPLNSGFQRLMSRFGLLDPEPTRSLTAPTVEQNCRFQARGLSLEQEYNSKQAVYAFYGKV